MKSISTHSEFRNARAPGLSSRATQDCAELLFVAGYLLGHLESSVLKNIRKYE
jgi:hypothetical protein